MVSSNLEKSPIESSMHKISDIFPPCSPTITNIYLVTYLQLFNLATNKSPHLDQQIQQSCCLTKEIYLLIKIPIKQAMSKKIHRDDSISESKKSSLSKKSKRTEHSNSGKSKISIEKLSHALYHHQIKTKSNKVVLYDEFESEKQDIQGSVTSRYLPMETDGECLRRCQKIENLQDRQASVAKKRCKEEGQRRLRDTRAKRKENKKQMNFQMMDCGDSFILTPLISVKDS